MADQDALQAEEKLIEEEVASHQPEISLDQPYPTEIHMENSSAPTEPIAAPAPAAVPETDNTKTEVTPAPEETPKKASFFARIFKQKKK